MKLLFHKYFIFINVNNIMCATKYIIDLYANGHPHPIKVSENILRSNIINEYYVSQRLIDITVHFPMLVNFHMDHSFADVQTFVYYLNGYTKEKTDIIEKMLDFYEVDLSADEAKVKNTERENRKKILNDTIDEFKKKILNDIIDEFKLNINYCVKYTYQPKNKPQNRCNKKGMKQILEEKIKEIQEDIHGEVQNIDEIRNIFNKYLETKNITNMNGFNCLQYFYELDKFTNEEVRIIALKIGTIKPIILDDYKFKYLGDAKNVTTIPSYVNITTIDKYIIITCWHGAY